MSVKDPVTSKKEAGVKAGLKAEAAVNSADHAKQRLERDQAAVVAAQAAVVVAQAKADKAARALIILSKKFNSKN
jgi:hypothetical protein